MGSWHQERLYDPQFREGAVRIVTETGKPTPEVAADPGIPSGTSDAFGDGVILYPEEEAVIARAVEKRRREFTAVRGCARLAMEKLGWRRSRFCPASVAHRAGPTGW
ncbi:4'-phosphopantetheinyl transferase EntD [Streptomyces rishiriensis]|uniref:4'-phosphopantetheinyl transferase EntD n=1 Tax=Streptomyces rishiriensis TaxID=68264 RepID=A0ABU0P328_STRRH|nr:4'-phosphopantetheinyl transferase EntD [Streptomyces rishiriensis]